MQQETGTEKELDPPGPPTPFQLACLAIVSVHKTGGWNTDWHRQ